MARLNFTKLLLKASQPISISDGYSRVNPTNWIYKDESGKIYVIKDSRFKRKYDAL